MTDLDDVIRAALTQGHAGLALSHGTALRYPADIAPFGTARNLADLWPLAAEPLALTTATPPSLPEGLTAALSFPLLQMVAERPFVASEAETLTLADLSLADLDQVMELVSETRPGPFGPRTLTMGRYVGIRQGGRLVAMAGERMALTHATEISAVCTRPETRGQGLAARLICHVAAGIQGAGRLPFLHVKADNPARGLYERLGFRIRAELCFTLVTRA